MSGSAGGHNGLKSIIQELGTAALFEAAHRGGPAGRRAKNHVLGRFSAGERETIDTAVKRAGDAAEMFVTDGDTEGDERLQRARASRRRLTTSCHADAWLTRCEATG